MKFAIVPAGLLAAAVLSLGTAAAGTASTYKQGAIKFTYPAGWSKVSTSDSRSLGQQLAADAKGVVTLAAVGGVESVSKASHSACVAVLAKMNFTAKYRTALKGHESKFITQFESGIKKSGSVKVTGSGTQAFAGQSKAAEIQGTSKSGGTTIKDQFLIAIQSGDKAVDMAIFVVVPSSKWGKCGPALASIAASSRFS